MQKLSKLILFIFPILLISFFTLSPSFQLALFGDDWQMIQRYIAGVGSFSAGFSKHVNLYLTAYGPPHVLMGVLAQLINYDSTAYYVISYFLRLFAAFSLFPITFYLTKNKLSAFFAVLFFSVTTTGFDTTNWVFNMTSYIAIGFFSLSLYFYLRSKEEKRMIFLLPAMILLFSAYITASIRMHAILPLLIILELFWNIQERNINFARKSLIRLVLALLTVLFIRFAGNSFGNSGEAASRFTEGINTIKDFINHGQYAFLAYPLASLSNIFIPNTISPFQGQISSTTNLIIYIAAPIIFIFLLLSRLLMKFATNLKKKLFGTLSVLSIVWTIIVIIIYRSNISNFSSAILIFLLLTGGYIFLLASTLIVKTYKQKSISTLLFLSFALILLSYTYAWFWRPELYSTDNRYLIVGASGAALFLSGLISLGKTKANQVAIFIMVACLAIIHIYTTRSYEYQLINYGHSQAISDKIWSSIPYLPEISRKKDVSIFYIIGDGTNNSIVHDSITFGLTVRIAVLYNISDYKLMPLPMDSWEEVISAVKDGKAFYRHYSETRDPIPVENVYVFKLEGKDHLIDLTTEARKKLLKII